MSDAALPGAALDPRGPHALKPGSPPDMSIVADIENGRGCSIRDRFEKSTLQEITNNTAVRQTRLQGR